jgi:hypothetical protein
MSEIPFKNKVVCINEHGWTEMNQVLWGLFKWKKRCIGPIKDDIVTVLRSYWEDGLEYYVLLEWPVENNEGWQVKDCFAPIQENFQSISYERVREEETKLISSN